MMIMRIAMLSYLIAGLLVILFMVLGLHNVALAIFGTIILSILIMAGINIYKNIKKFIKEL